LSGAASPRLSWLVVDGVDVDGRMREVLILVAGFLFGLISGGINNTGAAWGATDSWPTMEMQARSVDSVLLTYFVKHRCVDEHLLILMLI